jgi:predicted TIM-barrel enzyme
MSSLGTILSSSTIPHVRKACTSLLTQELLRPDGVQGLCEAMFSGEETGDGASIEKLEQIAHTLNSTPVTMKQEVRVTLLVSCWQFYN